MSETTALSSENEFMLFSNWVIRQGIQGDIDPDTMAKVSLYNAEKLYENHGAGANHETYLEYVKTAQAEKAAMEKTFNELFYETLIDQL